MTRALCLALLLVGGTAFAIKPERPSGKIANDAARAQKEHMRKPPISRTGKGVSPLSGSGSRFAPKRR